ncbi:MAG: hypothetical protein WC648_05235 [Candidatus Paceibacterota bacterium]|jgi:hypothetical protein
MPVVVTEEVKRIVEATGYGLNGDIGGIHRKTYWTPDGREIKAIPQIRQYVVKDKDGKPIRSGTRDANLDRGLLTEKPKELKPYCKFCDRWHDTQTEVNACGVKQRKMIKDAELKAKREEDAKTKTLEDKVAQLEAMVRKLTEAKA